MSNDAGFRDSVNVEVTGPGAEHIGSEAVNAYGRGLGGLCTLPRLPPRPDDGAGAELWLDYVVALGGDRGVFGQFGVEELIEFAGRFGG
jgi:hypothetical protein